MSRISSSRRPRFGAVVYCVVLALALLALPGAAGAQVLLNQQEALRLAFPGATSIERRTAFLGDQDAVAARELAGRGVEIKDGVVTYYVGKRGQTPLGVAYFDVHRVRTLPEVVMVVVTPRATVERIEILRFSEPPEYRAPDGWLDQFEGKNLSPTLSTRGSIIGMTGATLTSEAITRAARRVLALHRVIAPLGRAAAR